MASAEAATSPTQACIDRAAAKQFLSLLGKDPASARLRAFPHRANPAKAVIGARKGPFDLAVAEQWQREGRGIYLVINDGGDRKSEITACRAFFVEWDDRPIAWQLNAWRELGLPEPSLIVLSGGKSAHCYWLLEQPIPPQEWAPLQAELIAYAGGDPHCKDASRVMRLPAPHRNQRFHCSSPTTAQALGFHCPSWATRTSGRHGRWSRSAPPWLPSPGAWPAATPTPTTAISSGD